MKFVIHILLISFTLTSQSVWGQGQAGIWYFGERAGLDFNVTPSVALTDGSLDTDEGCSTVCTPQGDLLFYTDGVTVYNKNHGVMANGTGLDGHASATQSSIIVQQPGSSVNYYIFTVDAHQNNLRNGLKYSIVDLSQNGGLGAVVSKNIVLYANEVCEKITAVKHANGADYWIIVHRWDSRDFHAYLLTSSGLSAPVISTIGVRHNTDRTSSIGYMKTSPNGSKLAVAIFTQDRIELFDFNNSTGAITNPIQLNNYSQVYGLEFSPSGQFLYVSLYSNGEVYQFDVTSNDQTTINNSAVLVGNGAWWFGALQLAPDGRIYMAKISTATIGSFNLDVINSPDIKGVGCNFIADSKNLAGRRCRLGLPNFVTSIFTLEFAYQFDCFGDKTELSILSDLTNISSATWTFGDGTSQTVTTNPFTVMHTFPTPGTYSVNLRVDLISGGTDDVSQDVTIRALPSANDQTISVWEDIQGTGISSGFDLTSLENVINGNSGISYSWFSDANLTTLVIDPTNVSVVNGQQFWVEVNDGNCTNSAVVTFTVNSLPQAVDQNPVICEDNYNSGIASNINLTLLEPAITNNNSFAVEWYHDIFLSQPVSNTTSRVVSNGEVFYVKVSTGTEASVATVTYSVQTLPEGNDVSIQIWEDSFGSGFASGVDLNSYNSVVSETNSLVWYQDVNFTIPIASPENITVYDQDVFYAYIDNGSCINRGSIQFMVRSSPIANDLEIDICEETSGSGFRSNVDLTLLNGAINGGTNSSVNWYKDPNFTIPVSTPTDVQVFDGQIFYVLVQNNGESNSSTVKYSVLSLPIANNQHIVEFEDIPGSLTALGVDLTAYNSLVMGGQSNTIEWYMDSELTTLVPNPVSKDVSEGDIFYAQVSNLECTSIAIVEFSVVNTPIARDVFPEVCEDVKDGSSSVVDLTLLENQINEGNGDSFKWFFNWPTEPNGLPVNAIPDPTNVLVDNGVRFFAAVSDAFNTNVAVVLYTVRSLPSAVDQNQDVWEDSFGTGVASGVNLLNFNNAIVNGESSSVSWYSDVVLSTPVITPNNVSVTSGDVFYALVQDGFCQNTASLTFNVRPLPEANNIQINLCEDIPGSRSVSSYNLKQLESAINNDPGTIKEWFFDLGLSLVVPTPMSTTVNDGDDFFVRVSFAGESNVGRVDFSIAPLPEAHNYVVELCEDTYQSSSVKGENLTIYNTKITTTANSSIIWYSDEFYSASVVNPRNVTVFNGDIFYARIWDGNCENFAELSFNILILPETGTTAQFLCEDNFGASQTSGVNLNDYNSQITPDPNATILQWFEDDRLSIPVSDPTNVSVTNQNSFYALASNMNGCESSGRLNFYVRSLPVANDLSLELCEDVSGERKVDNYNLTDLENQISSTTSVQTTWFEDVNFQRKISNPQSYTIGDISDFYTLVDDGNCSNSSHVNFIIHEKPVFDLGRDTTIFYTETKVLAPSISIRFLPGHYLWQDGSNASTYTVTEEGKYTLIFTDYNGCTGSDSIMVYMDRYRIFVPNAFTPDGDGVNDTFGPVITGDITGEEIEMYIYNRWGEMIYQFTDFGNGWDGTYKGKKVSTGVYVWILIINGKARQDGSVSLIR